MKVAQVVSTFPPYKAGIGNTAYHLSWELAQLGDQVTVFTSAHRREPTLDESLPFAVRRIRPILRYGNGSFLPQLATSLNGFDIVHLHYPFFGGAEMIYLRDKIKPLNIILHYHMDVFGEGFMKRIFSWHSSHVMPRIIQNANKIIVTSMDYARQSLIKEYIEENEAKVAEIALGVNPHIFKPRRKDPELLKEHGLIDKKVILFVGALDKAHYFKGINYLIKAFQLIASNDDYRLLIVGSGDLKASYESIVTNFGLERKVIFAGYVPDDSLPLYYNLADLYVLPSIDSSEAFGIAVLEAMASGVPVIASDLPGVRSVVQRDETGVLVKPKHVDLLAKHMLHMLKNPQLRNKYGELGRERIEKYYTWDVIGKQVHELYEDHTL